MSDSKGKDKGTASLTRRRAVGYLAIGLGLAAASVLAPRKAHASYGKCTVSGCYCCGFTGNGNLCSNCGHQYTDHGGGTC